ncbi:MAG: hypothetical protein QNJ07_08315 [Woeseiaceae bacterium]|nr:hypothetical protein [Woeseiaceae bacterium]
MKRVAIREAVVFLSLLLFGVLLLPLAVYFVGQAVFGAYGGSGYGEFFSSLAAKLISFEWVAWFLVLSPYLAIQTVRLTWRGWRASATL